MPEAEPFPLAPAFADTTPMTTTPTTAPSAILPFMPMAMSPLGYGDRRPPSFAGRPPFAVFAGSITAERVNRVNTIHKTKCVHGRECMDLAYVGMLGVTVRQRRESGGCRTTRQR
ncbi:hypothetical protein GCM10022403_044070 [Streptomyces coacervatus]|uniref:Uncharacterized protein n=1 Tax=Streptomyces coacervatus TaxID=647381 RepID=A0ABP7I299_9ACTN